MTKQKTALPPRLTADHRAKSMPLAQTSADPIDRGDGSECTAGNPVITLPTAAPRPDYLRTMYRIARVPSVPRTLLHDLAAWPGLSWAWPYRDAVDIGSLPHAVPLLAARLEEAQAEVRALTDELTESYGEIDRLTRSPEFHADLRQIVAMASMFNGALLYDIVEAVEGISGVHRRTGVADFEVAASIKIKVLPGESGPVLDAEYQVQRKAQVVSKTAKIEGTMNLGLLGEIIPAPEPWKGTPMGRVIAEAGKQEDRAEAA